jgi:hypothetical protein
VLPGLGLGTTCQAPPFQCSTRVRSFPRRSKPTAQASHAESTVTPVSSLTVGLGLAGSLAGPLWQGVGTVSATGTDPVTRPASINGAANPFWKAWRAMVRPLVVLLRRVSWCSGGEVAVTTQARPERFHRVSARMDTRAG